eukprot:361885-Chlamydomonas_euryale.AAC.8
MNSAGRANAGHPRARSRPNWHKRRGTRKKCLGSAAEQPEESILLGSIWDHRRMEFEGEADMHFRE